MREAFLLFGDRSNSTIVRACDGRNKTYNNFIWRYASEKLETVEAVCERKIDRPVDMYNLNKKFIKHFDSLREAAEEVGCRPGNISGVCEKKQKSARGYFWEYTYKYDSENFSNNESSGEEILDDRSIDQYTIKGTFIRSFNNIGEFSSKDTDIIAVRKACNGEFKSARGYSWKYTDIE